MDQTNNPPKLAGVSRLVDSPQAVALHFDRELSDDEMRWLHETIAMLGDKDVVATFGWNDPMGSKMLVPKMSEADTEAFAERWRQLAEVNLWKDSDGQHGSFGGVTIEKERCHLGLDAWTPESPLPTAEAMGQRPWDGTMPAVFDGEGAACVHPECPANRCMRDLMGGAK